MASYGGLDPYGDCGADEEELYEKMEHNLESNIWVDGKGKRHNVSEMSASHLQNAIFRLQEALNRGEVGFIGQLGYGTFQDENIVELKEAQLDMLYTELDKRQKSASNALDKNSSSTAESNFIKAQAGGKENKRDDLSKVRMKESYDLVGRINRELESSFGDLTGLIDKVSSGLQNDKWTDDKGVDKSFKYDLGFRDLTKLVNGISKSLHSGELQKYGDEVTDVFTKVMERSQREIVFMQERKTSVLKDLPRSKEPEKAGARNLQKKDPHVGIFLPSSKPKAGTAAHLQSSAKDDKPTLRTFEENNPLKLRPTKVGWRTNWSNDRIELRGGRKTGEPSKKNNTTPREFHVCCPKLHEAALARGCKDVTALDKSKLATIRVNLENGSSMNVKGISSMVLTDLGKRSGSMLDIVKSLAATADQSIKLKFVDPNKEPKIADIWLKQGATRHGNQIHFGQDAAREKVQSKPKQEFEYDHDIPM